MAETSINIHALFDLVAPYISEQVQSDAGDRETIISDNLDRLETALIGVTHPDIDSEDSLLALTRKLSRTFDIAEDDLHPLIQGIRREYEEDGMVIGDITALRQALEESLQRYESYNTPDILAERRDAEREKLRGLTDGIEQRIHAKQTENMSASDFVMVAGNRSYQLPKGYKLYADAGWQPPQQMIDDVMRGGNFQLDNHRYGGGGWRIYQWYHY
jgi:hypothetical protein